MQDSGFQKKNKKWYQKLFPPKKKSNPLNVKKNRIDTCVRLVIRPLRIFQFLVVLLIFVLIIYTIMLANPKLSSVMCILLIVLSGVYLFVLSIDLINQFMGDEPHTIPMFIFSFLGSLLFGAAGIFLIAVHTSTAPWYILTIAFISLFAWILFIIDVSLIMAFWKRNCNLCQQCCYSPRHAKISRQRDICHPSCTERAKRDLTTSVSSVKVPSGDESAALDHSYRKTREAHRRQYVDCPTSARVLNLTDAADIQTEIHDTVNVHSQTQQQMKEAPVQTVSRCEMCKRQIQIFPSSEGTVQSTNQPSCAPCPALVQLLSGNPCCPGCRCVTGIIQVSRQNQQWPMRSNEGMEPTKEWTQSVDEKPDGTLTSNEHHVQDSKVTGTITKVTLASYCLPSKKANASCQTKTGEATKTIPINDRKTDEQRPAKRQQANGTERRDKERDTLDARKNEKSNTDKARKKTVDNETKKVKTPSARRVSETVAEKPLENSKRVEPSQGSATKEVSELSAEKRIETSEKVVSGSTVENPVKSSKENVPQNPVDANKPGEATKKGVSESSTEEPDRGLSKNPKDSSNEKRLKFALKNESFASNVSTEGNNEKTNVTESKKIHSSPRSLSPMIHRPREPNKDGGTTKEVRKKSNSNDDHSEGKRVTTIVKPKEDKKILDVGMSSEVLASSKNTADSEKVSDVGSKNDAVRSTVTKAEQSQETDALLKPNTETQTTVDSRRKKTHAFKRNNKIQPGGTTYAEMDVQAFDDTETSTSMGKSQNETIASKKPGTVDDNAVNICASCKRMQMPTTSSSFQYYNVHRDKRGRVYCQYCAPPNSVLHKKEGEKHSKCTGCGQSIRIRSSQQSIKGTSDNCPNCGGQMQVRVQSVVPA